MHTHVTLGLFSCSKITVQIGLTYVCNFTIFTGLHFLLADTLCDYFLSLSSLLVSLSGSSVVSVTNSSEDSKQLSVFSFSSFIATLYQTLLHSCALRTLPLLWVFSSTGTCASLTPTTLTPPVPGGICSGAAERTSASRSGCSGLLRAALLFIHLQLALGDVF